MVSLTDAKNYCRATDDDDILIESLISASNSYMDGAIDGFSSMYEQAGQNWRAKADLCMKMLIADWYERREPTERPSNSAIDLLITQLQLEKIQSENLS